MLYRWLRSQLVVPRRLLFSSAGRINACSGMTVAAATVGRFSSPSLVQFKSLRPLVSSSASQDMMSSATQDVVPSSAASLLSGYRKLRVDGLPKNSTEEALRNYFSQFGSVLSCRLMRNVETMEPLGHAFVVYSCKEECDCVLAIQSHVINGELVRLRPVSEFKLLLEGLSPATTKESLSAYFSRYRSVYNCDVLNDEDKGSRISFVHFSSKEEFNDALALRTHVIDGKVVNAQISSPKELTMFVGDLSPATTSEDLRAYFSQFGSLLRADVKQVEMTGESRCFGYVIFSSKQELDDAMQKKPHLVDGKQIMVQYGAKELQLFLPDLPSVIAEERFKEYFEQFGSVECRIARDKSTNRVLDYGFLGCSSKETMDRILSLRPHIVDGQTVRVESGGKRRKNECTLFVRSLPADVSEEMLNNAFSRFGRITESNLVHDRVTGRFKGYGFVQFDSVEGVRNALVARPHLINGKLVDVKPKMQGRGPSNEQRSSYGQKDESAGMYR